MIKGRPRRRARAVILLLLLPISLLFIVFYLLPLYGLLHYSFYGYSRLTGIIHTFTTENYRRALGDSYYVLSLMRTIRFAALTTVLVSLVGYPVAYYLSVASARVRGLIILFILSPLLVSVIVRTFGWIIILGPNGILDLAVKAFGFESGNILHTEAAAIIGLANVLLPFFVLSVASSLQAVDPLILLAASSLGAPPVKVFLRVILPLSMPGVLAGALIVFSLASSSYITPALLGGSGFKVLAVLIYQQALVLQNWPFAAALAVVLVCAVLLIQILQSRLIERRNYRAFVQ